MCICFFSNRRRHTRSSLVSWARTCVYETGIVTEAPHVFCEQLTIRPIEKVGGQFRSGNLRKLLKKHHGSNIDCAFKGWLDVWLHPDFAEWNIESCLPKIMVPQLVIQGNDDEYGTSAQVEAIVRQSGSIVETRFLDNCGHSPHRDQETQTLEFMTQFVRNLLLFCFLYCSNFLPAG